jgi:hypothetical protein
MGPCGGGQAGWGRGRGGRRAGYAGWERTPAPLSPEDEKAILERQKSWLTTQLEAIDQRLDGIQETNEA